MSSGAVIDDKLILEALSGRSLVVDGPLATTNCWWWRMSVALRRRTGGALSGPALTLSPVEFDALLRTIDHLPEQLMIPDLRETLPLAADLAAEHQLNLMSAEALAVAATIDADLVVATDNPSLARAAASIRVSYRVTP